MRNNNPVFVFNTHYNGLGVIRAFGKAGIPVIAMDTHRVRCPDPVYEENKFIEFLMEEGKKYSQKPLLFPTNDHWAMAVSRHRSRLEQQFLITTPNLKIFLRILDKNKFYSWAQNRNFSVPKTYNRKELLSGQIKPEYPIIVKPVKRRYSGNNINAIHLQQHADRLRLTRITDKNSLNEFVQKEGTCEDLVFQEEIPGRVDQMYTIGLYVDQKGDILGVFTGRKVRGKNPICGDCVVGQVERVPESLIGETQRLIKELKYTGIAEVEYKRDSRDGRFRLIEVNPRSWSWIGITPYCNVNLPLIAYHDIAEGYKEYAYSQVPSGSVKWLLLLQDLKNCLFYYRCSEHREDYMNFLSWWHSLKGKKVIEDFSLTDPFPTIIGFKNCIKYSVFEKLRRRVHHLLVMRKKYIKRKSQR